MPSTNVAPVERVQSGGNSAWAEKWLLPLIFRSVGPVPVRLVVGNGAGVSPEGVTPQFALRMRDLRTVLDIILDPEVGFGDAWMQGRAHVIGDLPAFLDAVYTSMAGAGSGTGWISRLISAQVDAWQANTLSGARENIHAHYDLGNDFYRLWLDSRMVYTCAYFPEASATLEAAQLAKMDHICHKLRLQPGETVVEAGCGWGALALHMARHYGVRVKAFNISREQLCYARRRAKDESLSGQVEFIEDDYRNVAGSYNAFVSVGMLEHVGLDNLGELGATIHRAIGDRGRGFLHFIGRSEEGQFSRWIRKRIFPGAYVPTLREALQVIEPYGYFVQDVENLRPHYAKTLEHWLDRFDRSNGTVRAMYGAEFERAWRLYLAGSIAAFRKGTLQLFQVLFSGKMSESVLETRPGFISSRR